MSYYFLMIWIFLFYFFFLYTLKDLFFFSEFFMFDDFNLFMVSIVPLVIFLVTQMIYPFFDDWEKFSYIFYFFCINLFLVLSFFSSNSLIFLFSLEMCVWPMIFLIYNFSKDTDKILSLIFMFLINILGSIPFMLFYSFCLNFSFMELVSNDLTLFSLGSIVLYLFFLLVLVCKFPIFLTHFWLTKAHVSASGSCSMILASLMLKLGTFGLLKFSNFFYLSSLSFLSIFFSLTFIGCFFILLVMTRFFDMKNLVACSSILHMAMIFPLVSYGKPSGIIGSVFMMVGHGIVSFVLFYLVTMVYEISMNRSFDVNKANESFSKSMAMLLIFFIMLNLGIPPFLNFFSELYFVLSIFLYSFFSTAQFLFVMFIPIVFVMFFSTKILFNKKIKFYFNDQSFKSIFCSLFFSFFLFFTPFLL